eukprot:CAMPEP_0204839248 /NCGR_PEP_ID=MMETSP1346-20131115/33495_1 /ASSEMBLY_ACC=CAM_ASM_000771 /TAXON_ID=215587 /ORGANISM="Aplanochytrium stocchinoi, Strain GSBS06" /LENGTH=267 /DNA_ID=CAMNT_0051975827 /DNA_START=377 /DNA_END=1180 /DNA_ORIENTATION=-
MKKIYQTRLNTLGSGNILPMLEVPDDTYEDCVDRNREAGMSKAEAEHQARIDARREWLAVNTIDFFNEISLIYGMLEEAHVSISKKSSYQEMVEERQKEGKSPLPPFYNGFPQGYEYRIKEAETNSKDDQNGHWYCNITIAWIEDIIDNPDIFPEDEDQVFPDEFEVKYVPEVFKRCFRIFAIIYNVLWPIVVEYDADKHINSAFKHFYFFMKRYDLLKKKYDLDVFLNTSVKKKILDLTVLDKEFEKQKRLMEAQLHGVQSLSTDM